MIKARLTGGPMDGKVMTMPGAIPSPILRVPIEPEPSVRIDEPMQTSMPVAEYEFVRVFQGEHLYRYRDLPLGRDIPWVKRPQWGQKEPSAESVCVRLGMGQAQMVMEFRDDFVRVRMSTRVNDVKHEVTYSFAEDQIEAFIQELTDVFYNWSMAKEKGK